ncbi:MAG: prepilin-type N-terminal cleavage/methylation domain-containing protein [Deltaproteobacteria bacterium]|nr:prepilin-type N-terminal cleavage/methylation domain-containing protein [Deltaproteobacteria bacterium]
MRSKSLNNHGYTLVEIVIVIVILGIIGAFTFQMVAAGVQAFRKSSARKELSDQGRLALERMAREIRDAYQIQATQSTADEFTFKRKHPGESADNIEEIKFWLDGTDLKRVGDPNGTPVEAVLASNVSNFTVTSMVPIAGGGTTGNIIFDNTSSTTSSNTTLTLSHTIGGGENRLLVVGISAECNEGISVTSVTYNGQALTKIASAVADTGTVGLADLWYLLEADLPPAGTYNVQVTTSGYAVKSVGATSLAGVAQQAPEASNTNTNVGPEYISTSITTSTDGAWIVDVVECGNASAFTPDGGQTERYEEAGSSSEGAGSTKEMATAGSTSMGWTSASANRLAHVVAAFAPAAAAPGGGPGVVQVDSVSSGATPTATDSSLTISHTTGNGDDRLMLVGVSLQNGDYEYVTGVTYNSTPLALVGAEARDDDSRIEIWKLVSPESGTHDVVITFNETLSNGATAGVITFTGVDPSTPHGTFTSNNGDSSAASINVPSANGELVFAVAVAEDQAGPLTTGAGQDERWSIGADGYDSAGAGSTEAGAANVSMSWTVNTSQDWVVGAVSLRQTRMVKLDLTLSSPEGGSLSIRTKVYMRNYQ